MMKHTADPKSARRVDPKSARPPARRIFPTRRPHRQVVEAPASPTTRVWALVGWESAVEE